MTKILTWYKSLPLVKQLFFGAIGVIIVAALVQAALGL
jgi:hypothetical protein